MTDAPQGDDAPSGIPERGSRTPSRLEAWFRDHEPDATIVPAATVVLVRDGADGLEALMLRRNSKLAFGGMWVFPGGRIDDDDRLGAQSAEHAARRAAVREAREEAALEIDPGGLVWLSHWTPPPGAPRRFATWFFVGRAPDGTVTVDGGEIHDADWMAPSAAITRRDAGEVELAPPTWMTLHHLAGFTRVDELLAHTRERTPDVYETVMAFTDAGLIALWAGDAGYATGDPAVPGARHRLVTGERWRLERDA